MFTKNPTDPVECHGISARIQIAETKSDNSQIMPKGIVQINGLRMEVEEQHKHVRG